MLRKAQSALQRVAGRCSPPNRAAPNKEQQLHSSHSMPSLHYATVVLGGGNAAGYVAREFVKGGTRLTPNELCIVGNEGVYSYERPTLSKAYLKPEGAARLPNFHASVGLGGEKQTLDWYQNQGIDYKLNTHVTSVDAKARTLSTADGQSITYDTLVFAPGARPITLPFGSDLEGLHYLRNIADADKLVQAIQETKATGGKAVVVGGGYICLEVAAQISGNGVDTTIVCPSDRLLSRLFTPKIAAYYEKVYADKGVDLIKNSKATGFEGADGKVQHVVVNTLDGEQKLDASLVVVGIGARPNTELLEGQVEMAPGKPKGPGGIKVDGFMRSSDPHIYVCGDCAAFPLKMAGDKLVRQEHVTNARLSATQAAQAIKGNAPGPYDYLPFFYSREFNLSWQFWGFSTDAEAVHFGDFQGGKFGAYFVKDDKVIGVFLESASPEEQAAAQKVAREQPVISSVTALEAQGISFATSRM